MLTLIELTRPAAASLSGGIHVEPLADVLDQVGRLLPVGELPVGLDPAASRRRVLELLPGEEPFRRGSPVHRHYAPTAKPGGASIGRERGDGGTGRTE